VHLHHLLGVGEALHDLPLVVLYVVVGHPLRPVARAPPLRPLTGTTTGQPVVPLQLHVLVPSRERERERENRGRNLRRAYVERRGLAKHTEQGVCFSDANSELARITSLLDCIF
jgi:hypothetical protein